MLQNNHPYYFCQRTGRILLLLALLVSRPVFAISDGERVSDERYRAEFHWAVAVVNNQGGEVCGGALIAPRWVLTAAHCAGEPRQVLVDSAMRSVARAVKVVKRIQHPDYNFTAGFYDVALLYLAEPIDIEPVAVATPVETLLLLRNGVSARIVGWGRSERSRGPENRLRIAEPKLNKLTRRGSVYAYEDYAGPCSNDSGSPMLMQTLDERWVLVGVARAAQGMCSGRKGAALYTNIGKVEKFIKAHVGALAADSESPGETAQ